ncbi:hypothetical protein AB5J62_22530 [Amycolatopsis sp. cg5]|uniref:hypothetical protein n=1 Tax=Amycolatopsis sp. cg5 TaxID=3238802 RepID=UPI003524ACA1
MGPVRRRRAIAEAARAAGLGEIVRIHRGHARVQVLWALVAIGSVPAAIVTLIQRSENSTTWQWPMLGWALLAGLAYLWTHLGPTLDGRQWIGVAQGGLVGWTSRQVWTATWAEAPDRRVEATCCAGDVRASIRRHAPAGQWTSRRLALLALVVLTTAAATWFAAVPIAATYLVGERPMTTGQFARMCEKGRSFGRTAAYTGSAPHPAVVFEASGGGYTSDPVVEPDQVQLVGCAVLVDTGKALKSCAYEGGHHTESVQGRYRVDLYEAQTAAFVGTVRVDGSDSDECSPVIRVPLSEPRNSTSSTVLGPTNESYRALLAPFVEASR